MRNKIIDEEVVESLIKFLDEIQFGTAEHGMKRSTVEIVKAKPSVIINRDKKTVWSLSNNEKKPKSGLIFGSIEKATIPEKPI